MHSPSILQCRCELVSSHETESRLFRRCPHTDQVLSKKPPAASLQGQKATAAGPPLGSVTGGRRSWYPGGKPCPKLQLWSVFLNVPPEALPHPRIFRPGVRR